MTNIELPIDQGELERMATALEASGDFRVLRRLRPVRSYHAADGTVTQRGIYLDLETTGLNPMTDEIIEIAMIAFDFTRDGRIFNVHEPFNRFRDPGRPIPPIVTALTGITEQMVAGCSIDAAEIESYLGPAVIVIAHNANFDRRFAERLCETFAFRAWACSWADLGWVQEGINAGKLEHLASAFGFFHRGHRAVHDCEAGLEILSRTLPRSLGTGLALLLESARQPRLRVWAIGAQFELKDVLRARGYRWSDGANGGRRAWYIDVVKDAFEAEAVFLRQEIYRRNDIEMEVRRITAFDRYSERA